MEKLADYITNIPNIEFVWVATTEAPKGEIIITEDIHFIAECIVHRNLPLDNFKFFLQRYNTYEDAYAVALMMREENPRCYNGDVYNKAEATAKQ